MKNDGITCFATKEKSMNFKDLSSLMRLYSIIFALLYLLEGPASKKNRWRMWRASVRSISLMESKTAATATLSKCTTNSFISAALNLD